MKYTIPTLLLLFVINISGCTEQPAPEKPNPFEGLWKLQAMEQMDSDTGEWTEWRNGMQGYLLYDATNTAALHMTTKGYENTDLRFPNFIDTIPEAALKHLTGSYVYFARYTVNEGEGYVEHARFSHSNPADWNKVVRRKYILKGDTLILQPYESENSNLKLTWVRSSE
jgi:hypothetical protein